MPKGSAINRRSVLKTTGAAGIFGLAGCIGGNGDGNGNGGTRGESDGPTEVRFILNPAEADVDISEQYQPMFEYLESEVDVTIDPVETASYAATLQEIRRDGGEIADTSPSAAVAGEDVADVIGIRVAFGAAQYFSLITTTPDDDGVDELAELEGQEIAMGATLSVSGTLVPMVMLKNAGLDVGTAPDGDAEDFTARYSDHSTARDQLINNPSIAAASTGAFSTAPHVPQEQFDEMSQDFVDISAEYESAGSATDEAELKLLAVSDPLPRAPLMSRSNWDDPVREEVEQAILNATEEDLSHGEDYEGEELWFTGVNEGSSEDFEPIADVLDELGLEFEDIS
jgi:phosphonate transport system substrate-binding protein